jgi:trk system potassium uptake protein TrkH
MVNWKIISKIIGSLLFIEAFFMSLCIAVAFGFREDDAMAFLMSTIISFGSAFVFLYLGREAHNALGRRDAYVVVTATWIVFSLFGMQPFLVHGSVTNLSEAFFETMSGFTTTGVTIISDVERLPHGILFWRSLMQWIGGLGIVFFTIAVLPSLVGGSVKVFAAEATGPIRSKMHPRLSTTAKWIWSIYLLLTLLCGLSYWVAGMEWFDAMNYAMTTTATGGFSIHNGTGVFFHSVSLEYLAILFMFLAGINFTLLYMSLFRLKIGALFRNSEFRFYVCAILAATLLIMYMLVTRLHYHYEPAFRSALFQVVSFITTTGLSNDNAGVWPHLTWVVLGLLMFMGACAGSTTGGFKSIRVIMLFKVLRNEFRQILHPNAVLPVKVNGQSIPQGRLVSLLAIFLLYIVMLLLVSAVMIVSGIDITNSLTIALSLISNVGAGLDTNIGPVMSWADLSDTLKWICALLMLVGRLEIMAVLVLFTRSFWKEN